MRQKEAAFAAVWITLGGVNLTLLFTGAAFPPGRPIPLGILIMGVNGTTLLVAGGHPGPWRHCRCRCYLHTVAQLYCHTSRADVRPARGIHILMCLTEECAEDRWAVWQVNRTSCRC